MKFHFSTVVWGPWHTGVYLDVNLPSLLAAGNLEAFTQRHEVIYRIFSSRADIALIQQSPAFQRAHRLVQFEFIECSLDNVAEPIAMHHALWRRSLEEAREAGAYILFIPPDVIWSNVSFGNIAEHFSQGKRAVFMTYMRVVSETAIAEVKKVYGRPDNPVIDVPSRRLVETMMRHIHPLTLTYDRNSENFPIHPEFILWSVPSEGILMRVLVRELFAFDPEFIHLNRQSLPAHAFPPEEVHYITDSDELFALSLAPLIKDIEWYARPQRLNATQIGNWWLAYDSPANDLVAQLNFYVHAEERTPEKWRRVELESMALVRRLTSTRELLRILGEWKNLKAGIGDTGVARQFLAFAFACTKLTTVFRSGEPMTFLIPKDTALSGWIEDDGERLFKPENSRQLLNVILDHVLLGDLRLTPGKEMTLESVSGCRHELSWHKAKPMIDGAVIADDKYRLAGHAGYIVDGVLTNKSQIRSIKLSRSTVDESGSVE